MKIRIRTGLGWRWADGMATCSKYFIITPQFNGKKDCFFKSKFVLTHRLSGGVMFWSNSIKVLRYLAGILSGLPMAWNKVRNGKTMLREMKRWPVVWLRWAWNVRQSSPK